MKKIFVIAAVSSLLALPAAVFAHESPYVTNASGGFVKDGSGNCVRSSGWFKDSQVEGCDVIKMAAPAPEPVVVAPVDTDGDGVPDTRDACESTPPGVAVDMRGCPMDSDGDGVTDMNDKCPDTLMGKKVDAKGCEIIEYEAVSMKLEVQFPSNSDEVASAYETQMKALAYVLAADASSKVIIKGYTDSTGTADYNMALSQRRADAVAKRLIEKYGVSPGQISAEGHGEEMPIASNKTAEGRLANRRVVASVDARVKK